MKGKKKKCCGVCLHYFPHIDAGGNAMQFGECGVCLPFWAAKAKEAAEVKEPYLIETDGAECFAFERKEPTNER